jgi:hypothetical protein
VKLRSACRRAAALLMALAWALPGGAQAATLQAEQDALQSFQEARQALAEGRLDEAELLLERVLMLMPEHAEARLEFALLLARRGQPDTARALILGLAQDPRTPAAYSQGLRALAASLPGGAGGSLAQAAASPAQATAGQAVPTAARPPAQWRAELGLAGSTNPLARTGAEGVVITLPDGPVTLPLSTRPQAGTVAGASLVRTRSTGGLELAVQRLDSPDAATAFRAAAWGEWPAQAWPVQAARAGWAPPQWQVQTLRGFDNLRRHNAALAAPLPGLRLGGAQRLVLGAYSEPAQQDHGWQLRAEHRALHPTAAGPLLWQASAERSASTARVQGYWRLNLGLELPLGPGRRLQAQATAQEDTHPYSPLLENNSRRRLLTTYAGLEQQWPLGDGVALVLRAFTSRRSSNLSLFDYRDTGAQAVLARQW